MRIRIGGTLLLVSALIAAFVAAQSGPDPSGGTRFQPFCKPGATNVSTAADARSAVAAGVSVCITASVGDVDLQSLSGLTSQVYVGTASGVSLGQVDIHNSHHITLDVRARSVDMSVGQWLAIDNSVLGGTGPLLAQRTRDQLVKLTGTCSDCSITRTEMAWTFGDCKPGTCDDPITANWPSDNDANTAYACRCTGTLDRFRFTGNWVHDVASDGIQGVGGVNVRIEYNEIGPVGDNPTLPNGAHTGYGSIDNTQHSDILQVLGNGPNLLVANNWFHGQGYYNYGDGSDPGSPGPGIQPVGNAGASYFHGGITDSLVYRNNLVEASRGRTEVGGLGTGGNERSNMTFKQNTFYDLGQALNNFPGFEWQVDPGSGNVITGNIFVDPDNGFVDTGNPTTFVFSGNLVGLLSLVTLDSDGNCTSSNCNPVGKPPIGYRKPAGAWW